MKINQPKFKMRKPIGLTLDFLDIQQSQKEQTPKVQQIDTFEEFCSQIPENQQQQELNFSKQSQSFHSQQIKSNNQEESICSEFKQSIINQEKENSQIQYIVFEEFHPQSTIISGQSESIRNSEKQLQEKNTDLIKEPPAPSNKNNTKFSFPQKGTGFTGLKKQLQIAIPEADHTNTSSYEQTMIKQQLKQNQMNNAADMELKQQIFTLQRDKEQIKNQYKLEIIDLNAKIQELQQKLDIEQANTLQLKQENEKLQLKIQQIEHQYSINIDKNQSDQFSISYQNKLSDNEKIQYLVEKLNQKSAINAKLQYEIFKLQNNIELLQTKQIVQSYNINQISDYEQISDSHSPPQFASNPPLNNYKNRESNKASVLMQQKQALLNLSANQAQLDQKKQINLSNMISPQAKTCKASTTIHKNLTTHQTKNTQFKEDTLQHLRKMQSTKNSTSVGELNTFKQDLTNCSNILQKIMRKDSTQSPDKPIQATQKFKEALNSKLQNVPDKHKSYASLLFSLGDFNKPRIQDAYIRQNSPHINEDIQFKSRQIFAYQPHQNSRKQSETIKSEESHKMSTEQPKYYDKYEYSNYQRKDILQLMRDIKSQKLGISAKINYKKNHPKYEKQYNLCQYKGTYF
ncbi:unnamed protein product [Paramecium primaurelia]|uniref:Uncharacterized protein n=1 Tax=Paramecium primaurelia TaxID=5886 RepID=A0A8S1L5Z1_PARPR|nr:unnamed protein product [Paramecium primaurelia]